MDQPAPQLGGEGLHHKYHVKHLHDPVGKHRDCPFFVLDIRHDLAARLAVRAYARAIRASNPVLAADLFALLETNPLERD
jgi:hypothetical protein